MIKNLVQDITELPGAPEDPPEAFLMYWIAIHQIHSDNMLHPCAEMLTLVFQTPEHLYQFGVHFADCDKDNHAIWPEDPEFLPWVERDILRVISEPIRAFHVHWRMPDYSVNSMLCEAEGYVHDSITIPAMGRPMATPFDVGDLPSNAILAVARQVWGPAWDVSVCQHKQQAMHEHDEDDDD